MLTTTGSCMHVVHIYTLSYTHIHINIFLKKRRGATVKYRVNQLVLFVQKPCIRVII